MKVLASTYAICLNEPPSPGLPLRYGQQTSLPACGGGGSREAFGARGDHAAGPLTSNSCFSGFEVSRAYRILATILANLSCSRESHSGGLAGNGEADALCRTGNESCFINEF
jgi:hypothetical protein